MERFRFYHASFDQLILFHRPNLSRNHRLVHGGQLATDRVKTIGSVPNEPQDVGFPASAQSGDRKYDRTVVRSSTKFPLLHTQKLSSSDS